MKLGRNKSLKRSLYFSFALAAILPIIVVSCSVLFYLTSQTLDDVARKNLLLAKAVSSEVEVFLREPKAVLNSIKRDFLAHRDINGPEDVETTSLLNAHVRFSDLFESIYVLGENGRIEHVGLPKDREPNRLDLLGLNLSHKIFFQRPHLTGLPTWSGTFTSIISGKLSLALGLPMEDKVLVGNFNFERLSAFTQNANLGYRVSTIIVDRDGAIIIHPDPVLAGLQVKIGNLLPVREGLAGREGTFRYQFEGEEYLGTVAIIRGTGWIALVSQTLADAYRPVIFAGIYFIGGLLGAILLAILFALAQGRRFSQPIADFIDRVQRIGGGQYDVSFPDSKFLEVRLLADSFLNMAGAVRDREELLWKSRERYRMLVERMNEGLCILDTEARISYVNPCLAEMLGWSEEDLLGKPIKDFFSSTDRHLFDSHWIKRREGEHIPYEISWTRRNGNVVHTILTPQPLFEENTFIGSFGVVTDITDRKRSEELIKRSLAQVEEAKDRIDAILKSVPNGLVVTDMAGRVMLVNRGIQNILDLSLTEIFLRPVWEIIRESAFRFQMEFAIAHQEERSFELDIYDRSNEESRTFEGNISYVETGENVKTGIIIVLHDVTGKREADRLKSEFIATAAHELNTPLTSVMGYTEYLLAQSSIHSLDPIQQDECLKIIYHKCEQLAKIVDELLFLSRLESGRTVVLEKTKCNLAEIVSYVVVHYRREVPDFQLVFNPPHEEIQVSVDRDKIIQVMENLLSNAIKYSPEAKYVLINIRRADGKFIVSVSDQGKGMSENQIKRVFEKFYRGDTSDTAIGGLGLGMTITRNIVEAHGGTIWVESRIGEGTQVFFTLPCEE